MFAKIRSIASVMATAAGLAACAEQPVIGVATPNYDQNFGMAVRQAVARQTSNPEASQNRDPVAGIDGPSAKSAIDQYRNSFRAPTRTFDPNVAGSTTFGSGSSGQ